MSNNIEHRAFWNTTGENEWAPKDAFMDYFVEDKPPLMEQLEKTRRIIRQSGSLIGTYMFNPSTRE